MIGEIQKQLEDIWRILKRHEDRLQASNMKTMLKRMFRRKYQNTRQEATLKGLHLALCVDTRDPWKQNRVRFYSPLMHYPSTPIKALPWAWPVSPFGGMDDSGVSWVPPPGTTLVLLFQNGNPEAAFYIGTTWQRDRGPVDFTNWNFDVPEYNKIFSTHRKGYMVGKNDESQSLPSNNTSNYQGYDIDTTVDTDLIPEAETKTTWPHEYRISTPEKHRLTMDDGDPKCNRRWKRFEIMSSLGHYFLMKDDPYHPCGEWVNPKCKVSYVSIIPSVCIPSFISTIVGNQLRVIPISYECMQGPEFCSTISETDALLVDDEYIGPDLISCEFISHIPSTLSTIQLDCMSLLGLEPALCHLSCTNDGKNRYHKHKQECFPFLRNGCCLPQSGMQLLSRAGYTLVFDDSVEQPRGRPQWEQALKEFDYDGCTGSFKGKTFWRSATGHVIEMNDEEDQPHIRGRRNGINIQTASGNQVFLADHSRPCCLAGELRGVHIRSTSDHTLDFVDNMNKQCSPDRAGCAKTGPNASKGFIRLRSGYGLQLVMADSDSQRTTQQQYIQLMAPQTDNLDRGPHIIHMQERASGPGQVFVRAGGDYVVYAHDNMVEVVGDEEFPSNKMEFVSRQKLVSVQDVYYNSAKTHVFWADDYVFLLAGEDCSTWAGTIDKPEENLGPCVYPVVVAAQAIPEFVTAMTGMKASEHVFASALRPASPCETLESDNSTPKEG